MEDVKTKSSYTEYPRKKYNPDEDIPNNYSFLSLVCGLVAVLFGSKIMGWASLFMGIASITTMGLVNVDKFNTFVTAGFAVMSVISCYIKIYYDAMKKAHA